MEKLAFDLGDALWSNRPASESDFSSLGGFISAILPNVYVLAGIILFIAIIAAGLLTIVSAGSGDEEKTAQTKKALTAAVVGVGLIIGAWWFIKIIEFVTGLTIF